MMTTRTGVSHPAVEQADAAGELSLARVAEDLAVRAKHDRQLLGSNREALDQGTPALIIVRVEPLVR